MIYASDEAQALERSWTDMHIAKKEMNWASGVVKVWRDAIEMAEAGNIDRMKKGLESARIQAERSRANKEAACDRAIALMRKWNETCSPEDFIPMDLGVAVNAPPPRDAT